MKNKKRRVFNQPESYRSSQLGALLLTKGIFMFKWLQNKLRKKNPLEDDLKSLENARRFLLSKPKLDTESLSALKNIHFRLFDGVYDHAGNLRRFNFSKGGFHFADFNDFRTIIPHVIKMSENSFNEIIDKYTEMNIVHPFCEGNGRSMRIWLDDIFINRIKLRVDWRLIDKNEYLEAMIQSPYDNSFLKQLLANNMTDKIDDKTVIFHGLHQSYVYEISDEYSKTFKTNEDPTEEQDYISMKL